ncbi:MAG TPA: NAD(P)H-dependent oxidoreductase [Candidatus Rothia avistercoris]|uniref:NAD(P)H-dependent oxidoreductase n=1 Tax=Candidatus Rothia avistercoris TaxID=2840479 RepID=A0A9D2ZSK0_9MICC|nr:NAD(P)H-dependent oxidoreductase [Candidatus Rothia avistercoris]
MNTPSIVVVTAGLGKPSTTALLGENLSEATAQALAAAGVEASFTQISLRSLATDITNHYLTGFPMGKLATALDQVREANALIVVSPVFKASYSGLFKSFWDLVEDGSLAGKPVLIAATGGTARHSLMLETAMRPLFSYLKATVAPSGVFAATDDFGIDANLAPRVTKAATEFAQLVLWTLGSVDPAVQAGQQSDKGEAKQQAVQDANAGSFFGILEKERGGQAPAAAYKAPGLEALTVTPFEELLKRNTPGT